MVINKISRIYFGSFYIILKTQSANYVGFIFYYFCFQEPFVYLHGVPDMARQFIHSSYLFE